MSGTVNKVILIGNLGSDVKVHYFEEGNAIGRFPLVTSEGYYNREKNERVSHAEWHNIVVRNRLAEICEKHLKKGDKIYIEGKLRTRKWNDNGHMRYMTEIHVDHLDFLILKKEDKEAIVTSQKQQSNLIDFSLDLSEEI